MKRFFEKTEKTVETLLGLMGLVGILLMTTGVITRYVLKISIAWSDEFLRTMFVWAYFIGGALMYSTTGLMRLELLDDFLKKHKLEKARNLIGMFVELCLAGFYSLTAYYVYVTIVKYVQKGTTSSTSSVPAWVLILGMGIGFVMIVLISAVRIIRRFKKEKSPEQPQG